MARSLRKCNRPQARVAESRTVSDRMESELKQTHDDEMEIHCCVLCGAPLNEREVELCKERAEQFDHQLLCFAHQRMFCGCPGIRGQKGP